VRTLLDGSGWGGSRRGGPFRVRSVGGSLVSGCFLVLRSALCFRGLTTAIGFGFVGGRFLSCGLLRGRLACLSDLTTAIGFGFVGGRFVGGRLVCGRPLSGRFVRRELGCISLEIGFLLSKLCPLGLGPTLGRFIFGGALLIMLLGSVPREGRIGAIASDAEHHQETTADGEPFHLTRARRE